VYDAVIVPSKFFGLCPAYILDLISTYADHGCKPELWIHMLIAHWSPKGWKFFKYMTWKYLRWSVMGHAHIVEKVSMSEEYRMVLGSGLEKFQSQRGLRDLKDLPVGVEVPVRVGWREMAGYLERGRGKRESFDSSDEGEDY
jgi:hypothetical protein